GGTGGSTTVRLTVPAAGCPAGTTLILSEKLDCTANIGPGTLTQRVINNATGATLVTITATGPGGQGLVFSCFVQGLVATKECTPTRVDGVPDTRFQLRVGQDITCTVRISVPVGFSIPLGTNIFGTARVTLSNATFPTGGTVSDFDCIAVA